MAETIEIDDVQSLVFSGHSRLPASLALGLTARDPAAVRGAAMSARKILAALAG